MRLEWIFQFDSVNLPGARDCEKRAPFGNAYHILYCGSYDLSGGFVYSAGDYYHGGMYSACLQLSITRSPNSNSAGKHAEMLVMAGRMDGRLCPGGDYIPGVYR